MRYESIAGRYKYHLCHLEELDLHDPMIKLELGCAVLKN